MELYVANLPFLSEYYLLTVHNFILSSSMDRKYKFQHTQVVLCALCFVFVVNVSVQTCQAHKTYVLIWTIVGEKLEADQ